MCLHTTQFYHIMILFVSQLDTHRPAFSPSACASPCRSEKWYTPSWTTMMIAWIVPLHGIGEIYWLITLFREDNCKFNNNKKQSREAVENVKDGESELKVWRCYFGGVMRLWWHPEWWCQGSYVHPHGFIPCTCLHPLSLAQPLA